MLMWQHRAHSRRPPCFCRYSELNQQPEVHEPKVVDGKKTFQRFLKFCNDLPHGVDYEGYFSGWFKGAPFKDIKRGALHP